MVKLSVDYWDNQYESKKAKWDIGYPSTPLKEYFDQLINKEIRILIPGAGRGWEAEYLFNSGFVNTYVLDYSDKAVAEFINRCPKFPVDQIIIDDFFDHHENYDLIVEQTFFSSLYRSQRPDYVSSVAKKLVSGGKLVGLLFNHEFSFDGPPWGGSDKEYVELFEPFFDFEIFEIANNSIKPRKGRELFMLFKKKGS